MAPQLREIPGMSSCLGRAPLYDKPAHSSKPARCRGARGAAEQQGDQLAMEAAWDRLGQELLLAGKPDAAEHCLLEGFRIRKLTHDRKHGQSYLPLSRLRLHQGDIPSAATLLD